MYRRIQRYAMVIGSLLNELFLTRLYGQTEVLQGHQPFNDRVYKVMYRRRGIG